MNIMRCYCLMAICVIVLTKGENRIGPRDNAAASVNAEDGRAARQVTETREAQLKALWDFYNRNIENYRKLKNSWRNSTTEKPNITAPEEKMLHEDKKPMVKGEEKSTDGPEEKMLDEDMKIVNHEISYGVTEGEMLDEDKKPNDKENVTVTDAPEEKMPNGEKKIVDDEKEKSDEEYTCDDEGRCLRIHYDNEYSWQDSKVVCETEGARLAVIADEEMNNLTNSLYDRDMKGPWIGMSVDSMGNMTWITGKSINDNERRKWSSENSRAFEDGMSECGVFSSDKWGLDRCDASRPFICEKVQ